jgi:hypothetical protein
MGPKAELFKSLRSTFDAMEMNQENHCNLPGNQVQSLILAGSKKGYQKKKQ